MVVPISFPEDGAQMKPPSAPELSPVHIIAPQQQGDEPGIHFKVGPQGDDVFVRGVILTVGFLAIFIRRRNNWLQNGVFTLKHVEKEGFDMLIKHLEGDKIKFGSITNALLAMRTAFHTECPSLCKLAVNYCDLHLSPENVLEIMKTVVPLNIETINSVKWDSSFFLDLGVENRLEIKSLVNALQCNCIIITGICADEILLSEDFLEMDIDSAMNIIYSIDLYISDELVLFNVLSHWCEKYLSMETPEKRRERIGERLIFMVRYGLMTEEEFLGGPAKSNLLLQNEIDIILKYIRNHKAVRFEGKMQHLDKERCRDNTQAFDLSLRTVGGCSRLYQDAENCISLQSYKPKKEKEPPKIILGLLRCWQVVFD